MRFLTCVLGRPFSDETGFEVLDFSVLLVVRSLSKKKNVFLLVRYTL